MPGPSWVQQAGHQITHTHLSRSIGFEICSLEERDVHALGQTMWQETRLANESKRPTAWTMSWLLACLALLSPVEGYAFSVLDWTIIGPTAGGKPWQARRHEWHPCYSTLGSAQTAWTNRRADPTQVSRCAHEVSLFCSFALHADSRSCRKLNP